MKVLDWEKANPIIEEFVEASKSHAGCIYYGWVKNGGG
jgi:quinol monooxygenase YgiN